MDAFAQIRNLIEESRYQEALEVMKSLTSEQEQLDFISILSRERKEIVSREIANVTSFENLNREYNALSLRMLNFLNLLEAEKRAQNAEKAKVVPATAAKARPPETVPHPTARNTSGSKTWIYLAGILLLVLSGWAISSGIGGGTDTPPVVDKKTSLPEQESVGPAPQPTTPNPQPGTRNPQPAGGSATIFDRFGKSEALIPATTYTTSGGEVDVIVAVYSGLTGPTAMTTFNAELAEKVSSTIREKTKYAVSAQALTPAFHQSANRRLWTTNKLSVLTLDTQRGDFLLLADWRTNIKNDRELVYSIFNLRNKQRIGYGKHDTPGGSVLSLNLEDTLLSALRSAIAKSAG